MFTRSAIFEGTIREGMEETFFAAVEERLLPIWWRLPHVEAVRLLRPMLRDRDAPGIFLIQEIDYPSLAAIEQALASPQRDQARVAHEAIMPMYRGRHYHIVSRRLIA